MSDTTTPSTWPDLAIALFEKLNERNAEITYDFEDFHVWVPDSTGNSPSSAPWKMNGTLKIRTQDGVGS